MRTTASMSILLVLFSALCLAAPAEQTVTSKLLHVKFAAPAQWKPEEVELPALDKKTPPSTKLMFSEFDDTDKAALFLVRYERKLSDEEAAKKIAKIIQEMRDTFKVTGAKTSQDREIKVANQNGHLIEGEIEVNGQRRCVMIVSFALDGFEYGLRFEGIKENFEKNRPAVERILATLEYVK
jgi:hypothetical protein